MIIAALVVLGLIFGSFINAVIWRVHEQELESEKKKPNKKYLERLSIRRGRSMCSNCHHELAAKDLVPVVSWLYLRGKCRYCKQPIPDNPLVEVSTALLFALSYIAWPLSLTGAGWRAAFVVWLGALVGLIMLSVYDLRWMILPNRILWPTGCLAVVFAALNILQSDDMAKAALNVMAAVLIGGGIFYLLFQISSGKWIGGGDVKLGWVLGLLVLTPAKAALFIFLAALLGTIASVPLLMRQKIDRKATIPFGPFLIAGAIIAVLWGTQILHWYTSSLATP